MKPKNQATVTLVRIIGATLACAVSIPAISATLSLEGYRHNVMSKRLTETTDKVDLYVDGIKVLTEKVCTQSSPCKVEIFKKAILSLCNSEVITRCQTNIQFDSAYLPIQRYAFIASQNSYDLTPYIVFSPVEMAIVDTYLNKQLQEEKQRDEIKSKQAY